MGMMNAEREVAETREGNQREQKLTQTNLHEWGENRRRWMTGSRSGDQDDDSWEQDELTSEGRK